MTLLLAASELYANIKKNKLNRYGECVLEGEQCGFRRGGAPQMPYSRCSNSWTSEEN
jgi:hypothetical protein